MPGEVRQPATPGAPTPKPLPLLPRSRLRVHQVSDSRSHVAVLRSLVLRSWQQVLCLVPTERRTRQPVGEKGFMGAHDRA